MPEFVKGIFSLLVILSVLVIAHELGHFLAARFYKMRVEDFSLFFGPVLFKLGKRGDTEYNIRTYPLGGFVKIAGMEPDDVSNGKPILEAVRRQPSDDPDQHSASLDKVLEELNKDTMAGIDPSNVHLGIRNLVTQAIGPDNNLTDTGRADLMAMQRSPQITPDEHKFIDLILNADQRTNDPGLYNNKPIYQRAMVIFAGPLASLIFGYLIFSFLYMTYGAPTVINVINEVVDKSPAKAAGLQKGDKIVRINDTDIPDGATMQKILRASPGKQLTITLERDGKPLTALVTPRLGQVDDEEGKKKSVGLIGIIQDSKLVKYGPIEAFKKGTEFTLTIMQRMVQAVSRNPKENLGGPLAMGAMTISIQKGGIVPLINMGAALSLSLGIMNLLPIPILDGGHLLLLSIEKLRRRKLSPREVARAQMFGLAMLLLLFTFVMFNDIVRIATGKMMRG